MIEILNKLRAVLFPGYFNSEKLDPVNLNYHVGRTVSELFDMLSDQISRSIRHDCFKYDLACTECAERGYVSALGLLEAIPEILEVKKAHYQVFREAFPGIEIRSVTSDFPSSELGVGVAHPAFPHETNKLWEIVEEKTSTITQLLWALGLIPVPVSDDWSFVLDVLFCGITLAGLRYHRARNMPFWKIDKYVRKHVGPNPFRAHDVIGAKGADLVLEDTA